ncbi:MAG: hypothetical protein MOB07_19285 [Acidobacteria bacterium]|nr:hypothetical protein [Acidobacteriota bacterium]
MKERIRWIAIGFGFMVGIQVLASLMFIGLGQVMERGPSSILGPYWAFLIFGLTLGAFFFGGFIIGRVENAHRLIDAVAAATATLMLSAIVFQALPDSSRDQFTGSAWLTEAAGATPSPWISALLLAPPLFASAVGAYVGYLMTTTVESMIERFLAMLGMTGAIVGPIIVLIISGYILPGYAVIAGLVIILLGLVIGYRLFKRRTHEAEDVSIRPEHGAKTTK